MKQQGLSATPQQRACLFLCMECDHKWKQKLSDDAVERPILPHQGKRPCSKCGSLYYKWLNFQDSYRPGENP